MGETKNSLEKIGPGKNKEHFGPNALKNLALSQIFDEKKKVSPRSETDFNQVKKIRQIFRGLFAS